MRSSGGGGGEVLGQDAEAGADHGHDRKPLEVGGKAEEGQKGRAGRQRPRAGVQDGRAPWDNGGFRLLPGVNCRGPQGTWPCRGTWRRAAAPGQIIPRAPAPLCMRTSPHGRGEPGRADISCVLPWSHGREASPRWWAAVHDCAGAGPSEGQDGRVASLVVSKGQVSRTGWRTPWCAGPAVGNSALGSRAARRRAVRCRAARTRRSPGRRAGASRGSSACPRASRTCPPGSRPRSAGSSRC